VVIAESHMSIHTWPEHQYAAIDLFTCGRKLLSDACLEALQRAFGCEKLSHQIITRGEGITPEFPPCSGKPTYCPVHESAPAAVEPYRPLHPEIFRYDDEFVARFIAPEVAAPNTADVKRFAREVAEQVYLFPLFTAEFCGLLIEEAEHHGGWVTVLEK